MRLWPTRRRPLALCAGACTDPGMAHPVNEDACLVEVESGLFAVADGIGGQPAGEVASRVAVEALPALVRDALQRAGQASATSAGSAGSVGSAVAAAVLALNDAVVAEASTAPGLAGMGTTVVLALVTVGATGGHACLAHVGDSRAYLLRGGGMSRLTEDHSLAAALVRGGVLGADQAGSHPFARHLTQAIGLSDPPSPTVREIDLAPGDRLLLCSDGLTTMLTEEQIAALLACWTDPAAAARQLVAEANRAGGRDNVSVVVVDLTRPRRSRRAGQGRSGHTTSR